MIGNKRFTPSIYALIIIAISLLISSCGDNKATTTISGNVLDSNGEPVVNAEVTIFSDPVTASTDASGFFSVEIETGNHTISISKNSTEIYSGSLTAAVDTPLSLDYISTSYTHADASEKLFLKVVGAGLFVLSDGSDTYFSKLGSFRRDSEGYLVNYKGYRLQGFGNATTVLGHIQLDVEPSVIEVSSAGIISYTANGESVNVAQIILAKFISPTRLDSSDHIHCKESFGSGQPIVTAAGNTGTGQILKGSLEGAYECDRGDGFFNKNISINGTGYFSLRDSQTDTIVYALEFPAGTDKQAYLENQSGYLLQGYLASSDGTITDVIGDINVGVSSEPWATTAVTVSLNLDSSETPPSSAFDVNDPDNTSNFSNTIAVYDSLGTSHTVSIYYSKSAENTWQWYAIVGASDAWNDIDEIQAYGALAFNNSGALVSESPVTYSNFGFGFAGGPALDQKITFNFGTSTEEGGTGLDGSTQFGSTSTTSSIEQDGHTAGSLMNVEIQSNGIITGYFNNDWSRSIGQIVLATFPNPERLSVYDSYTWEETAASGSPSIGNPGSSDFGEVLFEDIE